MSELNRDFSTTDYDNLVISAGAVGHIKLAAGQGELQRGSVINGEGKLLSSTAKNAKYILCDNTTTDDAEQVVAAVYKTGTFVRNSLITATGYAFADADAESLRDFGIIVEAAQE